MDSPWIAMTNAAIAPAWVAMGRMWPQRKEELQDAVVKDRTSSVEVVVALQPPVMSAKRFTATKAHSGLITRLFTCACFTNVKFPAAIHPSLLCEVEIDTARIQIFTRI